jgi:HEAT repeat protein
MGAVQQLDLFSRRPGAVDRLTSGEAMPPAIACDTLADNDLVAALSNAGMRDTIALADEVARRRLAAAVPALESVCRRFGGFGIDRIVPEQAAALDALAVIGGLAAATAVVRLITKRVVQGPCLCRAVTAAIRLRAQLPAGTVLELLHHNDPQIRAHACRCARPWPQAIPLLRDLAADFHSQVRVAAACALGRMGRTEARPLLLRYLREAPSAELIDAIGPVADEECAVLLGQIARAVPYLSAVAFETLEAIDHPRAVKIVGHLQENRP